jgi:predicted GIY-YIG superfamily endonuclease
VTDTDSRRTTAVYRMFNSAGVLLYVGASSDPGRRFNEHSNKKDWWSSVSTVALEHYATRQAALDAEQRAIVAERPLHSMSQAPCSGCSHPTTFHTERTGACRALGCTTCQAWEPGKL